MVEEKEAIERLYNMKNKVDVALMNSKYEKGDWLYDDVQGTSDTLRMAINALEKQIPKKPKERDCIGFNTLACPGCEMALYLYEPYCDNCGQAIDWSDEE